METIQERTRTRTRRRNDVKVAFLRRRLAALSVTGFAAFFGLAAQHAVGSAKRHVAAVQPTRVVVRQPLTYFDERQDGYAFEDNVPAAAPTAPPVAQTSVS